MRRELFGIAAAGMAMAELLGWMQVENCALEPKSAAITLAALAFAVWSLCIMSRRILPRALLITAAATAPYGILIASLATTALALGLHQPTIMEVLPGLACLATTVICLIVWHMIDRPWQTAVA